MSFSFLIIGQRVCMRILYNVPQPMLIRRAELYRYLTVNTYVRTVHTIVMFVCVRNC